MDNYPHTLVRGLKNTGRYRIGLDYDGTYTVNPKLWDRFIDDCYDNDIEVVIVTFRDKAFPLDHETRCDIHYTGGHAKAKFMDELGKHCDIWIDDHPELIVHDSLWTDEERAEWAKANGVRVSEEEKERFGL